MSVIDQTQVATEIFWPPMLSRHVVQRERNNGIEIVGKWDLKDRFKHLQTPSNVFKCLQTLADLFIIQLESFTMVLSFCRSVLFCRKTGSNFLKLGETLLGFFKLFWIIFEHFRTSKIFSDRIIYKLKYSECLQTSWNFVHFYSVSCKVLRNFLKHC